jgi:hypothetical protein
MTQCIIYKNDDGGVSIVIPAPEALEKYGINAIAGKPYKIIDDAEIPQDRTFRVAWTVDEAELTDGVGGSITSFEE